MKVRTKSWLDAGSGTGAIFSAASNFSLDAGDAAEAAATGTGKAGEACTGGATQRPQTPPAINAAADQKNFLNVPTMPQNQTTLFSIAVGL